MIKGFLCLLILLVLSFAWEFIKFCKLLIEKYQYDIDEEEENGNR